MLIEEEIHGGHGAGAELVVAFGESGGGFDQALVEIVLVFAGGNAVEGGADVASFSAQGMATGATSDEVFVEQFFTGGDITYSCFRGLLLCVDGFGCGEGEVVEPGFAFAASPAAKQAIKGEGSRTGGGEGDGGFFPAFAGAGDVFGFG